MKKNKKIIGIVLSLILIVGIISSIFIATANAKETKVIITADRTELSAGQSATVSVKVTANYPIATMSIPVFYDSNLVTISDATATLTGYAVKSVTTESLSADPDKVYANTGVNSDDFGFVLVTYIGGAGKFVQETTNDVVLTFKITAKADVSGTEVVKCVSQSAKTGENVAGMLYFGATVNDNVIDAVPENVEKVDLTEAQATVAISGDGTALVPNEELTGVIDYDKGYIYGVPAGTTAEDLKEYFTVNNGSFDIVANDAGYTNGTGATIVVKDASGNEVAYYTLVIFGDVNGDCAITSADSDIVGITALGGVIEDGAYIFAANVNADGATTSADSDIISIASLGGEITVNPYEK